MKKVISIVSVLSVLGLVACRNGNEELQESVSRKNDAAAALYYQRAATETAPSEDGNDKEPPRKDLLQWKGLPVQDSSNAPFPKP